METSISELSSEIATLRLRLDSLGRTLVSLIEANLELKQRLDALEGKPSLEQRVMFAKRKFRNG